MAKSIRSKSRRHNRAELRRKFSDPIIKKRQENVAEILANCIEQKSGSSMLGLKDVLSVGKGDISGTMEKSIDDDEELDDVDNEQKTTAKVAAKILLKEKLKSLKASKKSNSRKELVWFK
jgi:hypothetical protein